MQINPAANITVTSPKAVDTDQETKEVPEENSVEVVQAPEEEQQIEVKLEEKPPAESYKPETTPKIGIGTGGMNRGGFGECNLRSKRVHERPDPQIDEEMDLETLF